jgi:hypothetical protein
LLRLVSLALAGCIAVVCGKELVDVRDMRFLSFNLGVQFLDARLGFLPVSGRASQHYLIAYHGSLNARGAGLQRQRP